VKPARSRQPWSNDQLERLFAHEIWAEGILPSSALAGGAAAYWLPLLALYTGARCSELAQLAVADVLTEADIPTLRITDLGEGQQVKSKAGRRVIPIHSELVRLGFLEYLASTTPGSLWPHLRKREGKPGAYFSLYFGGLRRELKLPETVVFHSFRHNVRTAMAHARIPEPTIDRLLGHESSGSTGARVYTHIHVDLLLEAIEACRFPTGRLHRLALFAGTGKGKTPLRAPSGVN
jgi:integrase